ncbi:MAG: hypothetical protein K2I49_03275 [Ureaplasma sp.]|nr:hypothetical protein [Ureaplasma sp.]
MNEGIFSNLNDIKSLKQAALEFAQRPPDIIEQLNILNVAVKRLEELKKKLVILKIYLAKPDRSSYHINKNLEL